MISKLKILFFQTARHKWSEMMKLFAVWFLSLLGPPRVNTARGEWQNRMMDGQQQCCPFESQETANQFIFPRIL